MQKTKIVALIVESDHVVAYDEAGKPFKIPAENIPSVDSIVLASQEITEKGFTYIELAADLNMIDEFVLFQKASSRVEFHTVSKRFFDRAYGQVPSTSVKESKRKHRKSLSNLTRSVEEAKELPAEETTVVGVVDKKTIIPAEPLKAQVIHANERKSYKGLENFMVRVSKIVHKRQHSAEDLLTFIQRADLPITDSGDVLAYKRVNSQGNGVYTDCHSGKVTQCVGDTVMMQESMVDANRRNECSQGLHVARLQYLKSFSGNSTLIIRVAPEHFIAVPHGDPNKVRVMAYDIVGVVDTETHHKLAQSNSIKGCTGAEKLIQSLIEGFSPPRKSLVEIGGSKGSNLTITPLKKKNENVAPPVQVDKVKAKAAIIPQDVVNDIKKKQKLEPKAVTKAALSQKEQMMAMVPPANAEDAKTLLAWKKKQKKSWTRLNISDTDAKVIEELAKG